MADLKIEDDAPPMADSNQPFIADERPTMIESSGPPDINAVIAELNSRGIRPAQPMQPGAPLPPEAFQAVRPLERALRVKQLQGEVSVADAVNELKRRKVNVALAVAPKQDEAQIRSQVKEAQDVIDLLDPNTRPQALSRIENEKLEAAYAQSIGQLPEQFDMAQNVTPASFEEWYAANVSPRILARVNNFQGSDEQRAQFANQLESSTLNTPAIQEQYRQYVTDTKSRRMTIARGTPEYYEKIRTDLLQRAVQTAGDAAKIKALPGILEAQAKAEAEAPKRQAAAEESIRKEIQTNDTMKRFREQSAAIVNVEALANKPNPSNADDLALIYSFVKLLDPGSVVREGEIALTQKATPLTQKLTMAYNRLYKTEGGILDAATRQSYLESAQTVAESARSTIAPEFSKYQRLAQEQGVPLERIFNAQELSVFQQPTATPTAKPTSAPAATRPTGAPRPAQDLSALAGKRVRLKNGRTGVVTQNPDGSYSLK